MSNTLEMMARMRRVVVEEVRRDLVACLQAESDAYDHERAIRATLAKERALVSSPDADDVAVEAYVAWLPTGMTKLDAARTAAERATAATVQARARLNAGRAAEEAVARRLAQVAGEARDLALKREQATLDEAGQSPPIDPLGR